MHVQKLDDVAWSAFKSTAVASFVGYLLRCPKQATQLTLITSLGAAAIFQYVAQPATNRIARRFLGNPETRKKIVTSYRLQASLAITSVLLAKFFIAEVDAHYAAQAAMVAGLGIGQVWSEPSHASSGAFPTLVYPLLGALTGYLRPQLWTPAHGTVVFGLVAANRLARRSLMDDPRYWRARTTRMGGNVHRHYSRDLKLMLNAASIGLVLLTPWVARQFGQTVTWKETLYAGIALNAPDALMLRCNKPRDHYVG